MIWYSNTEEIEEEAVEAHEEVSVVAEAEEEEAIAVASEAVVVAEAVIEAEEEVEVEEEVAEEEVAEVAEEELGLKVQSLSSSHMRDSQGCTSMKEKISEL